MSVRAQLGIGLALVACALLAGYLLGRRPDAERERRIGELIAENRVLERERTAAGAVADTALKRAAHSDSAAAAAIARADRILRTPRPVLTPVDTPTYAPAAEIHRLQAQVDTLTVALEDTRNALIAQREVAAQLRGAVSGLVAQTRRDSLQIVRLTNELQDVRPAPGLSLNVGGGWKRAALFVGAGFVAGAIVAR